MRQIALTRTHVNTTAVDSRMSSVQIREPLIRKAFPSISEKWQPSDTRNCSSFSARKIMALCVVRRLLDSEARCIFQVTDRIKIGF